MYQIILVPKDTGATACMYYNLYDSAEVALKHIQDMMARGQGMFILNDDHGFILSMNVGNLSYALLIDVNKSNALHIGAQPKKRIYDS